MSQPAQKHPIAAQPSETKDRTGRFAIEESRLGTVLPPRGDEADLVSLEDVGAIMEVEADPRTEATRSAALPRGIVSGVFSTRPQTSGPPPVPIFDLHPRPESERARLEIEDLSLQPGNPYAASSLVPPPRKPVSAAKVVGIAAAITALAVVGWWLVQGLTAEPQTQDRTSVAHPAARAAWPVRAPAPTVIAMREAPAAPASHPARATRSAAPAAPSSEAAQRAPITEHAADKSAPATTSAVAVEVAQAAPGVPGAASVAEMPVQIVQEDAAAAKAALPQTPSREQVVAGFEAVQDALAQCAAGKHGVAEIDATIANSGRISHALIGGNFQGSPEGSCMARVVRGARFPSFTQPTLKVSYPIAL